MSFPQWQERWCAPLIFSSDTGIAVELCDRTHVLYVWAIPLHSVPKTDSFIPFTPLCLIEKCCISAENTLNQQCWIKLANRVGTNQENGGFVKVCEVSQSMNHKRSLTCQVYELVRFMNWFGFIWFVAMWKWTWEALGDQSTSGHEPYETGAVCFLYIRFIRRGHERALHEPQTSLVLHGFWFVSHFMSIPTGLLSFL